MVKQIALLGLGWLGWPLARALQHSGYAVRGSTTSSLKKAQIQEEGIAVWMTGRSGEVATWPKQLFEADLLILSIPPGRQKEAHLVYPELVNQICRRARQAGVQKAIFTSTTGVYPNTNGWVTEQTPAAPSRPGAKVVWQAEGKVRAIFGDQSTVIRFAGLAGPGREPGRFFAGRQDIPAGDVPVNFIHLDDAIGLIMAIIEQEQWGSLYNGCADEHPIKREFYPQRAALSGYAVPQFSEEGHAAHKIISNAKSVTELGYMYLQPDPMKFPADSANR